MAKKEPFGKIFQEIYDSTISDNWKARLVFMDMVVLSDEHGEMPLSLDAFQRRTNVPLEIIEEGIKILSEPDTASKTSDHDGRRIIPAENGSRGWLVINKPKYWSSHITQKDREQAAGRKRRQRQTEREEIAPIPADDEDDRPEDGVVRCETLEGPMWVRKAAVAKWKDKYPEMDVVAELEDLRDWLELNPDRRKPAGGLHTWLGTCLSRTKKKGDFHRRTEDDIDMSPSEADLDPHHPSKHGKVRYDGLMYDSISGTYVSKEDFAPLEGQA